MAISSIDQDAKKWHILKTVEVFRAKEPVWICPFCVPPAFSLPLTTKNGDSDKDQQRKIIIQHLEFHEEDVRNVMRKSKMPVPSKGERERRTTLWIDATYETYDG